MRRLTCILAIILGIYLEIHAAYQFTTNLAVCLGGVFAGSLIVAIGLAGLILIGKEER